MTSGPYHCKRLKNWRGDQVILHVGNNSLFPMEHSGKEIEVSGKRKTDTNRFYGNTVWIQCISNGEMTVFVPNLLDAVIPGPYTSLTWPEMPGWKIYEFPISN